MAATRFGVLWRRSGEEYASSLARSVAERCLDIYNMDFRVYVADSTGLSVPYKAGVQGPKVKLHAITLLHFNIVLVARITLGQCHNSPVFRGVLEGIWGSGVIIADSAYFSKKNMTECLMRRLISVLKPKGGLKEEFLKQYESLFESAWRAYRYRGAAEGSTGPWRTGSDADSE